MVPWQPFPLGLITELVAASAGEVGGVCSLLPRARAAGWELTGTPGLPQEPEGPCPASKEHPHGATLACGRADARVNPDARAKAVLVQGKDIFLLLVARPPGTSVPSSLCPGSLLPLLLLEPHLDGPARPSIPTEVQSKTRPRGPGVPRRKSPTRGQTCTQQDGTLLPTLLPETPRGCSLCHSWLNISSHSCWGHRVAPVRKLALG